MKNLSTKESLPFDSDVLIALLVFARFVGNFIDSGFRLMQRSQEKYVLFFGMSQVVKMLMKIICSVWKMLERAVK